MDCSPPGSSVHGDSPGKKTSELPCPPPGDLASRGIELTSLMSSPLQADPLPRVIWEALISLYVL